MGGWKVLGKESAEFSPNVGVNVFTIWWVKPYNITFPRSSFVWMGIRFIFYFALVSAPAHGFFILWDGLVATFHISYSHILFCSCVRSCAWLLYTLASSYSGMA